MQKILFVGLQTELSGKNKLKGKELVNSLSYMSSFLLEKLPSLKPHGLLMSLATP